MTDKRMLVVTCCRDCPIESDCKECQDALDKNIPASCPLPKLPSVMIDQVMNVTLKMLAIYEVVKKGYLTTKESATDVLADWLKSIGVEIEDGD